jgi:hypothetical protein
MATPTPVTVDTPVPAFKKVPVKMPDGSMKDHNFPSSMSDEDIGSALTSMYPPTPPVQNEPFADFMNEAGRLISTGTMGKDEQQMVANGAQYLSDKGDAIFDTTAMSAQEAIGAFQEVGTKLQQGTLGAPTDDPAMANPLSLAADLARPLLKTVELTTNEGINAWKQTWGKSIAIDNSLVRNGVSAIKDSSIANFAMTALGEGMEAWGAFEEKYPLEAGILRDTGVVSEVAIPKLGAIPGTRMGLKQVEKGNRRIQELRKNGITNMLMPATRVGDGVTETAKGPLGTQNKKYIPTEAEDTMIEAVGLVDDVDPTKWNTHNYDVIYKESKKLTQDTKVALTKAGNPYVNIDTLKADLQTIVNDITSMEGYDSLFQNGERFAEGYFKEAIKLLDNLPVQSIKDKGPRVLHLLEMRKQFDAYVEAGSRVYDPAKHSAKQTAARQIRDAINQRIKAATPNGDAHDLMNRTHQLINAQDVLKPLVAKEANNSLIEMGRKAASSANLPSTPLALAATGVYAGGAAAATFGGGAAGLAAFGGATAGTYGAYRAWKSLTNGKRRRFVGRALKEFNASPGDFAIERIYLLELLKQTEEEEKQEAK